MLFVAFKISNSSSRVINVINLLFAAVWRRVRNRRSCDESHDNVLQKQSLRTFYRRRNDALYICPRDSVLFDQYINRGTMATRDFMDTTDTLLPKLDGFPTVNES